jgi:hypothetical protein
MIAPWPTERGGTVTAAARQGRPYFWRSMRPARFHRLARPPPGVVGGQEGRQGASAPGARPCTSLIHEYHRFEYGGLPAKCTVFVIALRPNMFRYMSVLNGVGTFRSWSRAAPQAGLEGVGVSGNDGVSLAGIGLQLDLHSIS